LSKGLICPKGLFIGVEKGTNTRILIEMVGHADNASRIFKEINLLAQLEHDNILRFDKWFCQDQNIYQYTSILMDLGTASYWLETNYPSGFPEDVIRHILNGLLGALEYLHAKGIIHRSIRAENIFLDSYGNIRLSGFHHAICISDCDRWIGVEDRVQQFDETLSNLFIWLAPEILRQDLRGYGVSSDIYSVGICICELGNGFSPFQEMEPLEILFEKLRGSTPYLLNSNNSKVDKQSFSKNLQQIVASCLCYDPEERPTAKRLLEEYLSYLKMIPDKPIDLLLYDNREA